MKQSLIVTLITALISVSALSIAQENTKPGYAIVVSGDTLKDEKWSEVVTALKAKYKDQYKVSVIGWSGSVIASVKTLREVQPKYICFVAPWKEANKEFVQACHVLTRKLDEDPYTDAIWAVLTGFDASDALRIIAAPALTVDSIAAGTGVSLKYFDSGIWYSESDKNRYAVKESGKEPVIHNDGPDDTTKAIAEAIGKNDLFITSGHASQRDWAIGYSYRNGRFVSQDGQLYGITSTGDKFPINLENSKIHLASGNCLIGQIDGKDCMALALIHTGGFNTMIGYLEPTWFGYMGWGIQDYYVEQPGRFTVAEAFFANNQAIAFHLERLLPGYGSINTQEEADALKEKYEKLSDSDKHFFQGLSFDHNKVAIYGDPAWQTALKTQDSGWKQELTSEAVEGNKTQWTLTITPLKGAESFKLVTANGSQRGGRPIFQFLPTKVGKAEIADGNPLNAVVTDNFILLPASGGLKIDEPTVLKFTTEN